MSPLRQTVVLTLGLGLGQLAVAVSFAVLARSSTVAEFGTAIAAIAMGQALALLLDFGMTSFSLRELAAGRMSHSDYSDRASSKLATVLGVGTLVFFLAITFDPLNAYWSSGAVAVVSTLVLASQIPLRVRGKAHYLALLVLIERTLSLLLVLGLCAVIESPAQYVWAAVVIAGLTGVALTRRTLTDAERPALKPRLSRWTGSSSSRSFGLFSSSVGLQAFDLPLLTAFGGASASGIYGAVNRWTSPMNLIGTSLATTLAPVMASESTGRDAWVSVRRATWLLVVPLVLCLAVWVAAEPITVTLLGSRYAESAPVLQLLAMTSFLAVVNQPTSAFLLARGFEHRVAVLMAALVVIQLGIIALSAGSWGALGAAASALTTQLLFFLIMLPLAIRTARKS